MREGSYQKHMGKTASQALAIARDYLGYAEDVRRMQMRRIEDGEGNVIASDLRPPRYESYGTIEIIGARYIMKEGGMVEVRINIPAPYERGLIQPRGDWR
jgi:hypothetical protein